MRRPDLLTWNNAANWMDTEHGDYLVECFDAEGLGDGASPADTLSVHALWDL